MPGMDDRSETTELRRGVLGPCVLALLEERPRFGLELVRDLSEADGLLTSQGTVYPLLNRLRDNGLVTSRWIHQDAAHPRRYYSITDRGCEHLAAFRAEWSAFASAVDAVLRPGPSPAPKRHRAARQLGGT
jgi:PadR family transcriptional regulator PadR